MSGGPDIGIEAAFAIWLDKKYGPALSRIYREDFKAMWEDRQLLCPACGRTYSSENYKPVNEEGSVRLRHEETGARKEFKGRCTNDGSALIFYLVGEDPSGLGMKQTALREEFVRLVTEEIDIPYKGAYRDRSQRWYRELHELWRTDVVRTSSFYQGMCNMSETSARAVLRHLAEDMKQIREERYGRTAVVKDEYVYRATKSGFNANEEFLKKTHGFSLEKPIQDFIVEIFDDFERRGILTLVERTITDRPFGKVGRIRPGKYKLEIWDISSKNLKRAKEYYRMRFPLEESQ